MEKEGHFTDLLHHTDPVVYRLYEALLVYGYPLKHIIHEKFGDGECHCPTTILQTTIDSELIQVL